MTNSSLSNSRPIKKGDVKNSSLATLDLLKGKLSTASHIMYHAIENKGTVNYDEFVSVVSGAADLVWNAHVLCGQLEPSDIAAEFEAMSAQSDDPAD